jgi:acetoin utilization deacetylase AcuC-like enzyme
VGILPYCWHDAQVSTIPVVWSPQTLQHVPGMEIWIGVGTPGTEVPERVELIRDALTESGHPVHSAREHDDSVLLTVHDASLVEHLRTVYPQWVEAGFLDDPGQDRVVPYVFPTEQMLGPLPPHRAHAVHARAGTYAYDTMTVVGPGTFEAARAAIDCALTAVDLVASGEVLAAYALCRPPGHHVTRSAYGGSCYLNNAAVAAEGLRAAGHRRVAVVDLDAHHGNGTAAIFYERADVLYGSVHVDPGAGWFPHFVGFADERGAGEGEGSTRNLPLAPGTGDSGWLEAVTALREWIEFHGVDAVVVSLGVDAAGDDPESPLLVTEQGYREAGRLIGGFRVPSVIVQEGGYHLDTIGGLVGAYLDGHAGD